MDVPTTGAVDATQIATTPPAPTPAPGTDGANATAGQSPQSIPHDPTLTSAISRLFGSPSEPKSVALNVSYRVVHDPNMIVTVFTDPLTGEEVAQFPPEIIIGIAQFFDQQQGVTLDRSA